MKKEKPTTKTCKHCKTEIPYGAKVCPQCRKKQGMGLVAKIIIVILVIGLLGSCVGSDDESEELQTESPSNTVVSEEQEVSEDPNLTTGQKSALASAKSYLDYSAFSYSGLIEQLEYEGYTTEDATYAVDNCGADWNEQALASAISYLDYSAFSYKGLKEQLEYEGFTSKQATYGADNCDADWSEQAVKCAESYLEYSSFSRSGLIEQLEYEGFTSEQAEYGATGAGY